MVCFIYISNSDLYIVQSYAVTNTLLLNNTVYAKMGFYSALMKIVKVYNHQ